MFKKALQIVVTLGMLLGGYQVYLVAFAMLTDRIGAAPTLPPEWKQIESRTSREARRLAIESFGADHWTAKPDLRIRFYDAARGFYMYAGDYTRLEDGKKFEFFPFAIIWLSKGGAARKLATSDRATVELNEKLGLGKSEQAIHVIEARLEQQVVIRDDKGTLLDPSDDLVVGPLPDIKYSEKTKPAVISSVNNIKIVDRNLMITGYDLLIELRDADARDKSQTGFDAQMARLKTNTHIAVKDVGKSGVLPGTSRSTTKTEDPTPLDLRSDGEMRIDFPPKPKPLRPMFVGPPEPEGPTYATFQRNVVVERGKELLKDILNCDTLRLTLLPAPKSLTLEPRFGAGVVVMGVHSAAPGAAGVWPRYGNSDSSGPLTELAIREANATGFAVWLTSTAQGIRAKCNELIYKKQMPVSEDETYLRGTLTTPIEVVKTDHEAPAPNAGKVTSVTSIWALDAKIFDDGKGGSASTVRSRGPGRLETRPALDQPAEHGATWQTELVMQTIPMPADRNADPKAPVPVRRLITLTGDPKLQDFVKAMKLEAKQKVVASLKPRDKSDEPVNEKQAEADRGFAAAGVPPAKEKDPLGSGSYQIEWIQAKENVRLTSPGKTMIARDELNAPFEHVAALANEPASPVRDDPAGGPKTAANAELPKPDGPAFGTGQPANADTKGKPPANAVASNIKPEKPAEPNVEVTAHRVWAKIRQANGKSEIAEARLRGEVKFHQDAAPDKKRPTNVTGEALDLETMASGKMKFRLFNTDPSALADSNRLAANGNIRLSPILPARIETEDYTIIGPAIYLDQSLDYAWVNGRGSLTQLADRGFLSDKGVQDFVREQNRKKTLQIAQNNPGEKKPSDKIPFIISWADQMQFFGRATDPQGRPAGKMVFRGDVNARMEDGFIHADEIDAYTDRPVSLAQPKKQTSTPLNVGSDTRKIDEILPVAANRPIGVNGEDVPMAAFGKDGDDKPEMSYIEARSKPKPKGYGTVARNVKRDPETGEHIENQYISGDVLTYDRRSGDYRIPGKGEVYLWRRSAEGEAKKDANPLGGGGLVPTAGRTRPVSNATGGTVAKGAKGPKKTYTPWELTQIRFEERMQGRFGSGKSDADNEWRTADFFGAVQVLNAPVSKEGSAFNFDDHPPDFKRMTADSLRVASEPPDPNNKGASAQTLVTAEKDAQATTRTHTVAADIIKYDSDKQMFHAYGLGGRQVTIVNQARTGQQATTVNAEAAEYNYKTGESKAVNASSIQLLEPNGGIRPVEEKPAGPAPKAKRNQRPNLRPPPRGHIERRGFGGH